MAESKKREYDLEERTAKFSENVLDFARKIPKSVVTIPLISQLVRSATSIGSNYCEADDAESRKELHLIFNSIVHSTNKIN